MNRIVYLDHNATTPVRAEAAEAMAPFLSTVFGNPSSVHTCGQAARKALEDAREELLDLVGATGQTAIFTSGGTESIHLALHGLTAPDGLLALSAVEHHAVLQSAAQLAAQGIAHTVLGVDADGIVSGRELSAMETEPGTGPPRLLASIQHANNETGVIQPLADLARRVHAASGIVHTDACQSTGKLPVDFGALGVDALSLAAHKFGGPKGTGALIVRKPLTPRPFFLGGHQERGLRAGTENVAGAVGLVTALRLAVVEMDDRRRRTRALRDMLETRLLQSIPDGILHGATVERLDNTVSFGVRGVEAQDLVMAMDLRGFAISAGAACDSGAIEASHVLRAMGVNDELARGSVRFSLSPETGSDDVERAAGTFVGIVRALRGE